GRSHNTARGRWPALRLAYGDGNAPCQGKPATRMASGRGGMGRFVDRQASGRMARSGGLDRAMRTIGVILAVLVATSAAQADDIISMISQYRRVHGLPAVRADATLMSLARQQARAMAARGAISHTVAGSFASRIAHASVGAAGENVAV